MYYDVSICIHVCVSICPYTQTYTKRLFTSCSKLFFNWLLLALTISSNINKALDEAGPAYSPSSPPTTPSAPPKLMLFPV